MSFDPSLLPDLLPIYYSRFFPTNVFCRWLSCGSSPYPLSHRELSFTLSEDVYIRYLSITNQKELQALFQKKCPYKIDVGAVYNTKPSISKHDSSVLARELVFDIDLTDYDDVRTCCQGADVCPKCWKFMVVACQILDTALKDDFGFSRVLWVYSGRRGVHCWVSSWSARSLGGPGRSAVADYLSLLIGGEFRQKKVNIIQDSMHTSIKRAHKVIEGMFDEILADQQFLSTEERVANFLKLIPDDNLAAQVQKGLAHLPPNSTLRWKTFTQIYKTYCMENNSRRIKHLIEEIQLQWCYPRLDVNVTKGSNHLLKAPFSIHPKTGRVCVVFRAAQVAALCPETVPSIGELLEEQGGQHARAQALMQEAVSAFQDFVWGVEKEEAKRKREIAEESMEF